MPPRISERGRFELLKWYRAHKRDMPWRGESDPYRIWVSEVMLQQTQVDTVRPYYERWIARFPTLASLAVASEEEVLSLWQGLGYYRRAKLLLAGARFVIDRGMPESAQEWRKVPGVGAYTAGAIASICFGEVAAVVDGNVERVYARLNSDRSTGSRLNRAAWAWAKETVDPSDAGTWNQALMEFGSRVCRPRNPYCVACPLSSECQAHSMGIVFELPTRPQAMEPRVLRFRTRVLLRGNLLGLRQITSGPWWLGLWEFPSDVIQGDVVAEPTGYSLNPILHQVTKHRVWFHPHIVSVNTADENVVWFSVEELADLPLPAPQRKILKQATAFLSDLKGSESLLSGVYVAG